MLGTKRIVAPRIVANLNLDDGMNISQRTNNDIRPIKYRRKYHTVNTPHYFKFHKSRRISENGWAQGTQSKWPFKTSELKNSKSLIKSTLYRLKSCRRTLCQNNNVKRARLMIKTRAPRIFCLILVHRALISFLKT